MLSLLPAPYRVLCIVITIFAGLSMYRNADGGNPPRPGYRLHPPAPITRRMHAWPHDDHDMPTLRPLAGNANENLIHPHAMHARMGMVTQSQMNSETEMRDHKRQVSSQLCSLASRFPHHTHIPTHRRRPYTPLAFPCRHLYSFHLLPPQQSRSMSRLGLVRHDRWFHTVQ